MAHYKKCGRNSEAVESGMDLPSEEENWEGGPLSPGSRPAASGIRLRAASQALSKQPAPEPLAEKPDRTEKDKKAKKKQKKKKSKSSSSSEEPSAPRSSKSKKVVINIG